MTEILENGKENLELVAVKKIQNVFMDLSVTRRVLREIKILKLLKGHNNVSKLIYKIILTSHTNRL